MNKSKQILRRCDICYKSRNKMLRKSGRTICYHCYDKHKGQIAKGVK